MTESIRGAAMVAVPRAALFAAYRAAQYVAQDAADELADAERHRDDVARLLGEAGRQVDELRQERDARVSDHRELQAALQSSLIVPGAV